MTLPASTSASHPSHDLVELSHFAGTTSSHDNLGEFGHAKGPQGNTVDFSSKSVRLVPKRWMKGNTHGINLD